MKKIILFSAIALLVLATVGCDKDENTKENQIIGTWKCIGFGNTETGKIKTIEPTDCDECYILIFKDDGTFGGRSCANVFKGKYEINGGNLKTIDIGGTKVGEMGDCKLFHEALFYINSYKIVENELLLYYPKDKYLLFKFKIK